MDLLQNCVINVIYGIHSIYPHRMNVVVKLMTKMGTEFSFPMYYVICYVHVSHINFVMITFIHYRIPLSQRPTTKQLLTL